MADLGDLMARLLLDGSQWSAGMKKAEGEAASGAANIEGSMGGIGASIGKMGEALAGLAIAGSIMSFADAAVEASMEMNKFRTAMVNLKGPSDDVETFVQHIEDLESKSPFDFPELAESAKKMVMLGQSMDQAEATMTAIVETGTALKLTAGQVTGIADSMSKLGQGAEPMRVMKALVSEGIPAWQMLAKEMGVSIPEAQKAIKEGAVGPQEAFNMLTTAMSGNSEKAAAWGNTWAGSMRKLKDQTSDAMRDVGDNILAAMNAAAPLLQKMGQAVEALAGFWRDLSTPVKDAVLAFGGAVAISAGVGAAFTIISAAIAAISGPVAAAVLGIAAVTAALVGLGVWVNEHWAGISNILTNAWSGLKEIWQGTWDEIVAFMTATWDTFASGAKTIWDTVVGGLTAIWDGLTTAWSAIWDGIWAAISLVWNTFKTELRIFDAVLSYLLPFWDPIKAAFLAVWNEIVTTITTAWNKIKGIFAAATGADSFLGKVAASFGIVQRATANAAEEMTKSIPVVKEVETQTKKTTGAITDQGTELGKTGKEHKEIQDKFKASKDSTALLWAESAKLNSEYQKLVTTVANNRMEADKMAASHQTLADKVTAIKIPTTDASDAIKKLGEASSTTMGQIAAMSTVTGAAETAIKNMGFKSSEQYTKIATDSKAAYDAVMASPLSTPWDKANASAVALKAEIDKLTTAEGDHKDKLEELKTKLGEAETAITNMKTTTTDAYHELNLNTTADIDKIIAKDNERWTAAKTLADTGNPAMIRQMHEAELAMLKDYDDYGIALNASQKTRMEELETELGKHHDIQKEAWKTFLKDVKGDFDTAFSAMEDKLITGDGSFHDIWQNLIKGLAKDALDLFLTPLKTAIENFIATTLKSLLGEGGFGGVSTAINKLGTDIAKIFGGGGSATPGIPSSVPGLPNVGATPGAPPGGAASSAIGMGLSGVVGMISGAVTAISSVISNFQFAHMETSLNAIEHNTRYTMMYVGERADGGILGILFKIDEEIAWGANTKATENLRDLFKDWSNLVAPIFESIRDQLVGLAPYIVDSKVALEDIRGLAAALPGVINKGFDSLNITVTATGVTTAEAAKVLGDQIAANLSRQLVPVS